MPPRSSWKGFLKVSLVSVPVKAFTASSSSGSGLSLNQLHAECNSRIRYIKTCPIHGEIPTSEIVSGYEYAKDQYVVIDTDELEKLRTESDKAINVDAFIDAGALDAVYQSGKTYYVVPDSPIGQKPFALLRQAMIEKNLHGIAQVVMHGKEQLVLVRPIGKLMAMTVLNFTSEVKQPATFEDEIVATETSDKELQLAGQLIEALTESDFDLSKYKDTYTEKLSKLIEAKVAGQELVSPPSVEEPQIINLMDALRESVAAASKGKKPAAKAATSQRPAAEAPAAEPVEEPAEKAPKRRMAKSAPPAKPAAKKSRKSG